jgi:hypothetical protein
MGITADHFASEYSRFFTDRRPLDGRGRGKPRLLLTDEVELFFERGAEAVLQHRRLKGRLELWEK